MESHHDIAVPDIGDYKNASVIELFVKQGDTITEGMDLLTLETDKAAMDVPSPYSGVIRELVVKLGDKVSEGNVLMRVERSEKAASVAGVLQPEVESTAAIAATAPIHEQVTGIAIANPPPPPPVQKIETSLPKAVSGFSASDGVLPYASPSIRHFARELDVPLEKISGTGRKGRITRDDILSYVKTVMYGRPTSTSQQGFEKSGIPGLLPWPQIDFEKFGTIERKDIARIRKISAANLHRNWVMIPHVTNHEDADITDLEKFRAQMAKDHASSGVRITLLSLLMKACAAALKKFPEFNASLDGDQMVLKNYYHIGFAADTPNGLVVPVIRDADKKGIAAIAREMGELSAKAREGKLAPNDINGGSFSISSLGGIGGTYFTPIINAPEVAILGVGKSQTRVMWNGEAAEPRLILPLSLSWDHRAVDGAAAGRFNAYLVQVLADMRRVLM